MTKRDDRISFKQKVYEVIFEAETPAGKLFDVVLLWLILLSIGAVMLESVQSFRQDFDRELTILEWIFTLLFSFEYLVRIYCVERPFKYVFSFFGIVDLLALVPTYMSLFFVGSPTLLMIRALRLLRIFRILKLARYTKESRVLIAALKASRPKITVFLGAVLVLILIMGSVMYMVEGTQAGFTSIPRAMYWAVVTLTTVGYGDIVPKTVLGQSIASFIMICGYAIIAVPTGIVSVELANVENLTNNRKCKFCKKNGHNIDALFCMNCGEKL